MASFEWSIGLRYTRAKRRNGFISFISGASMIGIALGVAALITVLSVMNGFQREVRSRILEAVAHIQVSGPDGRLDAWPTVMNELKTNHSVLEGAPYVQSEGMLAFDGAFKGAMVRGIDPVMESTVAGFGRHMRSGKLQNLRPDEFGIVLGSALAQTMGVRLGDHVRLFTPEGNITPAGLMPRWRQFTVVGIFHLDNYQYDSILALINISDAQRLYRLGDAVSGIRLKVADPLDAPRLSRELAQNNPRPLYISDWTQENAQYFRAVEIEKRMMFLILTLIVAVAAFNLVSGLVMSVTDKQADIAILQTLGATPMSIMKIFMVQGSLIGIIGTLSGVAGGLLLGYNVGTVVSLIERLLGFHFLSPQLYLITELPSEVQLNDVMAIAAISLVLSLLATIYPSWRASRTNPAEALRYE